MRGKLSQYDVSEIAALSMIVVLVLVTVFYIIAAIIYSKHDLEQGTVIEKKFKQEHMNGKVHVPDKWYLVVEGKDSTGNTKTEEWAVPPMVYREVNNGDTVVENDCVVQ